MNERTLADSISDIPRESRFIATQLNYSSIAALIDKRIVAIKKGNYFDVDKARNFSAAIVASSARENYRMSDALGRLQNSNVDRIGIPLSELYQLMLDPHSSDQNEIFSDFKYLAIEHLDFVRRIAYPSSPPIDLVRLSLDEAWPLGATWGSFGVIRPHIGIVRIMQANSVACAPPEPHIDRLPPQIFPFAAQLSAIVYLQVPESGGEIEIWFDAGNETGETTPVSARHRMPSPITIHPDIGDLIVINTGMPHAVRGFTVGTRIVQTCFVGVSKLRPLLLWS